MEKTGRLETHAQPCFCIKSFTWKLIDPYYMDSAIKIFIVDDEIEACKNLKNILLSYVDERIEISGMAHNTIDAEQQIRESKPDVVLLDINMPNENAFEFLERIRPVNFEIIFVTAYDEFGVKAFKLNAIDYVLKPINIYDLKTAIRKVKQKLLTSKLTMDYSMYQDLSDSIRDKKEQQQIILRDNNHYEVVMFSDILYVEAMGSYARIVFMSRGAERNILMSHPIAEYEELFPDSLFFRIHRSYLVNRLFISKIQKEDQVEVVLKNNVKLPVSRRRQAGILAFFNGNKV